MKRIFIAVILLLQIAFGFAQAGDAGMDGNLIPTANLTTNTLWIQNEGYGSAVYITVGQANYLLTAKHLFPGKKTGDTVLFRIFKADRFVAAKGQIYFHTIASVDGAVIKLDDVTLGFAGLVRQGFILNNEPTTAIGQSMIFLGYPGVAQARSELGLLPLVKRGILSGVVQNNDGSTIFLLDGHNNKGFSGGPIFANKHISSETFYLVGLVVGYYNEAGSQENSGIIVATPIFLLKEIINSIPIEN